MSKTNGIGNGLGSGASLAIGTVATVVVIGSGVFLARGGVLGQGAQSTVEDTLAMLGLIDAPAVASPAAQTAPATPIAPASTSETAPASTPQTAATQEAATTPAADEATVATAAEEPAADAPIEEPAFTLAAPKLELARFETDGSGLIAGAAQPGVEIDVLLDGAVIQNLTVEEGGEFAAFVTLEPSDQPRVISLVARFNGEELASEDSFILAPLTPVVVAEAEVQTTATPEGATSETVAPEAPATTVASSTESAATPETSTDVTVETSDAAKAPAAETGETVTVASSETAPEAAQPVTAEAPQSAAPTSEPAEAETATAETAAAETATAETAAVETPAPAEAPTEVATATPDAPTAAASEGTAPEVTAAQTATSPNVEASATEAPTTATEQAVEADAASAPKPDVAVAVLRAGADGVTLVQPATPSTPELVGKVALDTISYSDSGDVQLAGRAKPEALVRVYLDNSPVSDITVDTSGYWSGSLTSIAPGIYTLRLDEIDPVEGKVLSRLETPFKREAPEALQPIVTAETSSGAAVPRVQAVTVQKGDTLWAISQARYGSGFLYVRVFEANKGDIRNPDLIYPGQIFTLPE